ncbi:MAG TPA: RHS repeat domain-containing protein [Pyrinomonadaceae bacterium]|nr:RHS repeat domain-containing protein [Pyrinomonadaceae bacterium]
MSRLTPKNKYRNLNRAAAILVCLTLLVSSTPLVAANSSHTKNPLWRFIGSQGQGNGPRPGSPQGNFPNMDEMRRITDETRRFGASAPTVPPPIPSTRRRWRREVRAFGTRPDSRGRDDLSNNLLAFVPGISKAEDLRVRKESRGPISDSPFRLFPATGSENTGYLSAPQGTNFATARLAPQNRTGTAGVDLLSKNFNWSLGLIGLRGRSGLDLGLGLSYNSKVWTVSSGSVEFDLDQGTPGPGFRLGFPIVQGLYYHNQAATYFYMLITPAGQRVELRRIGGSNVYQTVDATYAQLTDYGSYLIYRSDGAQLTLVPSGGEYHCTEVKDRNGNYLTVTYNGAGDITTVTDTLSRVINFSYDGNGNLTSLTQTWGGQTHTWATFGYGNRYVGHNFPLLTSWGPDNEYILVLTQVGLADGSRYNFEYNDYYGMVSEIRHYAPDNHERRRTTYDFTASGTDCPLVSAERKWAENWNGDVNGVYASGEEVVTSYGVDGDGACRMTLPNGVIYKEYYGTGWQAGLTTQSEVWSGGVKKKWRTTSRTQDNTGVSYLTNPRVTETNVYDAEGNRRRTTIYYGPYEQYSLPYLVREYAANGTTEIRHTYTDYNLGQPYLDRRIIGLVAWVHISDTTQWLTKITYGYDDPSKLEALPAAATRHDQSFNTSFLTRGNVTSVSRWDVTDINNPAKALTTQISYNVTGSLIRKTDPSNHPQNIAYSDSFSDGLNNRNTFAYPTTATDADGYSSYLQYNFDFGALTRTQGPPPAGQSQGAITTMTYDATGRIQWVNNLNNGAWKYFTYASHGDAVMSQETISEAPASYWSITVVDGADRVRLVGGDHPGSSGGYAGNFTLYDVMGRVSQKSNPAETNAYWTPTGDDAVGWFWTQQTYDWQGRPLITTNPDGTTKEASYGGCGCAGGAVVTLTDEGTLDNGVAKRRQQKIYSDVLGRTVKTEVLNWQGGSVYSATVNTYNGRDQITQVRAYAGAEGSGSYQDTTMTYDPYGRLKTRHAPEQNAGTATTWDYNLDDTIQKITDARGASQTISYNGRHLTSGVTYFAPAGITPTSPLTFAFDAAGNRLSMIDAVGTVEYSYDELSQLKEEKRTFSDFPNSPYTLRYEYNLARGLKKITDVYSNTIINYSHDPVGRLSGVAGEGFGTVAQFASGIKYRAWGAVKEATFGNSRVVTLAYGSRLMITQLQMAGVSGTSNLYFNDGRLKYAQDLYAATNDRSYAYDHVGRVTEGLSGAEARGLTQIDGPYRETFQNDAWGNLVGRTTRLQQETLPAYSATYVNTRNAAWTYDADGRVTANDGRTSSYDAAGNAVYQTAPRRITTQKYDGDGFVVKRLVENPRCHSESLAYSLRSTALGGQVVSNITQFGSKNFDSIYASGELLATHHYPFHYVYWRHQNPANGSGWDTNQQGAKLSAIEVDPAGGVVGTYQPDDGLDCIGDEHVPPIYLRLGDPRNLGSGCTLDYGTVPCSLVMGLTNNGSAEQCPNNECDRINPRTGRLEIFHAYNDGYSGYLETGGRYLGNGLATSPSAGSVEAGELSGIIQMQRNPQNSGEQLSGCLRDALRSFFPQQNAQGSNYSPVDDARFKNGIPGLFHVTADPSAVTLGLYDVHYDPDRVNLHGGTFESLKTIVEEVAHTVQFLQVWGGLKKSWGIEGEFGIDSTGYNAAKGEWAKRYAYFSAKGEVQNGDGYKNDVERWAKNRTFDVLSQIQNESKTWILCGFSLSGTLERPNY